MARIGVFVLILLNGAEAQAPVEFSHNLRGSIKNTLESSEDSGNGRSFQVVGPREFLAVREGNMDLYWIKFPKVGSPFAATIIGYACNSQTQVTTPGGIFVPDDCNRTRVRSVLAPSLQHIPSWFETPVEWSNGIPLHNIVALFRDPIERRRSEFNYFRLSLTKDGKIDCCGFIPDHLKAKAEAILQTNCSHSEQMIMYFEMVSKYQGCMTNMLLGHDCFHGTPSAEMVSTAVRMVERKLKFVGLQSRWNDTVSLWHRVYGGTVFPNEKSDHTTQVHSETESEASNLTDVDSMLIDAAVRRFNRDMAKAFSYQ